jgi:UDP-2,3-diacylglucosamine pyrophosphatase LpxH
MDWQDASANFIGLTFGVLVGLLLSAIVIVGKDILFEWICERFEGNEEAFIDSTPVQILVSDVHIDTWDYPARPGLRAENFVEFLGHVKQCQMIESFVLNGDLMDIPENPTDTAAGRQSMTLKLGKGPIHDRGPLDPKYSNVQLALAQLGSRNCRFVYQTGNHDIGITGLRFTRNIPPGLFPQIEVSWNPQIVIEFGGQQSQGALYLEHGHHYDPAMSLYIRTEIVDILRGANISAEDGLISGLQRHGLKGPGTRARRHGLIKCDDPNANIETPPNLDPPPTQANWDFQGWELTIVQKLLRLKYRWAARHIFRRLARAGRTDIKTVTMGHIHIPDRYVFKGGYVYINSGDWCGNTQHQCYTVLHENGRVSGPHQWVDASHAKF